MSRYLKEEVILPLSPKMSFYLPRKKDLEQKLEWRLDGLG